MQVGRRPGFYLEGITLPNESGAQTLLPGRTAPSTNLPWPTASHHATSSALRSGQEIPMPYDEEAGLTRDPRDEHTGADFAALASFLFARTDPLLLARPIGEDVDRALQALNDTIRHLLGQARAHREWQNEVALACSWDALTGIARQWDRHPDFDPDWAADD
ncbi:hypothetical protein ACH419_32505 [Streptomyces bobili]